MVLTGSNERREQRERMVERQIAARGIADERVLRAMRTVPREAFVPDAVREFAYDDTALPIAAEQTISQPYVVALMLAAVEPAPDDRALEVGTGSGYAAAVLSRVVGEVWTIERHRPLAEAAKRLYRELGYDNIHVRVGDGTRGWQEHAPFDAILVTAGGPEVPSSLRRQLAPGGRLVIPVGETQRLQRLLRVRRPRGAGKELEHEDLGPVQFVPLIGAEGWREQDGAPRARPADSAGGAGTGSAGSTGSRSRSGSPERAPASRSRHGLAQLVRESAEPLRSEGGIEDPGGIRDAELEPLLERIGAARVVLLGEATHGTSEFYRMRARITRALVERLGFDVVAVEADWPDAARIDDYVRLRPRRPAPSEPPFTRFPTWMWRNLETHELVEWLREHNARHRDPARRVTFCGLDLYSMYTSLAAVLRYLDGVDSAAAAAARARYGCLTPWERDPVVYGRAVLSGAYEKCEPQVVATLQALLRQRVEYGAAPGDGAGWFDAVQNARVVAGAERYYRVMYYGTAESWNLRDQHMFDTLQAVLSFRGRESRAVVWAHNSHLGDASATEMAARGEHNLGQLCRRAYHDHAYLVGFGTDHGTVAAAPAWDAPMQIMQVRPSHADSYERVCHDGGVPAFLLPLRRGGAREELYHELLQPRLERAIGVIYRPESELQSHYFQAELPRQFDEYVWFDETRAVGALPTRQRPGVPKTYPFGV